MGAVTLLPRLRQRFTRIPENYGAHSRLTHRPSLLRTEPVFHGIKVPGLKRDVWIKFASTRAEWEEAFQLVSDNYQARGYEAACAGALRFTSYHALPDTAVLVAQTAGRTVATFSLVADNHLLGLPLENAYRAEIGVLRRNGRRMFETISLADRDLGPREFVQVLMTMTQVAFQYGVANGGETNVITVNPRHRDFYTKVLGYAPLGPRRSYVQVQGHPAEAFFLDPSLMLAKVPGMHQRIFHRRLPREVLAAPRMPAELVRHFARRSSQTDERFAEEILAHAAKVGSPRRW